MLDREMFIEEHAKFVFAFSVRIMQELDTTVSLDWKKKPQMGPMSHLNGLKMNSIELREDEELPVSCKVKGSHPGTILLSPTFQLVQTITTRNLFQVEKKLAETVLLQKVHSLDSLSFKISTLKAVSIFRIFA